MKIFIELLLLVQKRGIKVLLCVKISLESGDLDLAIIESVLLPLKLHVEVAILLLSISEDDLVVVDLVAETSDEGQVALNAGPVVLILSPLLVVQLGEVVL